jgi:preprotein translocase subunit SecF
MRYKWLYFLFSALIILPGIYSLIFWGLKPSIDFTGGSILEIKNTNLKINNNDQVEGITINSVQKTGQGTYLLKFKEINQAQKDKFIKSLEKKSGKIEELRFETIGPVLGKELIQKTFIGVVLAAGFILFFLGYQFKDRLYGICATIATFHDSLVILGIFSLLGHFMGVEVDTLFVTAILTSLSFSVHDTVVVYHRIRETMKTMPKADFEQVVDKAVTETMSRSVNNSLTIIFMLVCLLLLGGETIKWFVLALLIGTISGTYSSPFVATPFLLVFEKLKKR